MRARFRMAGEMARGTILALAVSLALAAETTAPALAQCQYSTVVIEGPPCPFGGTAVLRGQGLNNHGHVVGWWDHCGDAGKEAFFWSPETGLMTLPRPDGVFRAIARDINDHGIIVGEHWFSFSEIRAFAYDMSIGTFEYLQPLHDVGTSAANAINNHGIAVGRRSIGKTGEQPYNAVIWNTNTSEVIDLGVMEGPNSEASAIGNQEPIIVGWTGSAWFTSGTQGFVWTDKSLEVLTPIRGGDTSEVRGINDNGVAVGAGLDTVTFISRGFHWQKQQMTILDPLPGFVHSGVQDINNLGQSIGWVSGNRSKAILWQHDTVMELGPLAELAVSTGTAINETGQILAPHIGTKAAVLTPISQPFTDLDANCRTDVHDLIMLLDWWGECPPVKPGGADLCRADINGDGMVNVLDLLMLIGNWD